MSEASDKIRMFILEELLFEDPDATITDETPLLGGIIDSLGLMQLVAFIEETFEVQIADGDITSTNFRSVADIDRLLARGE